MSIILQKKSIRNKMRKKRNQISSELKFKYDKWICEEIYNLIKSKNYKTVHCYLPIQSEIDIFPLIKKLLAENITLVCPKTSKNRKLEHLVLQSTNSIEKGILNTLHPSGNAIYNSYYDLIIVPGLAFDKNNYRLGYGGGYYDTFLKSNKTAEKAGLFYPFQEVDTIPRESHDVQLDNIIVNKDFVLF